MSEKLGVDVRIEMTEAQWGQLGARLGLRLSMHQARLRECDLVDGVAVQVLLAAQAAGIFPVVGEEAK